jgi:hypothetical protein
VNKDNARDYLPLVQALYEGKVIQYKDQKCDHSYGWMDIESAVDFCMPSEFYRIKPEPREIWVNEYPNGVASGNHPSRLSAFDHRANDTAIQVCYREVLK